MYLKGVQLTGPGVTVSLTSRMEEVAEGRERGVIPFSDIGVLRHEALPAGRFMVRLGGIPNLLSLGFLNTVLISEPILSLLISWSIL